MNENMNILIGIGCVLGLVLAILFVLGLCRAAADGDRKEGRK